MSSCNDTIGNTLQQRLREHAEMHRGLVDYDGDQRMFADDLETAAAELDTHDLLVRDLKLDHGAALQSLRSAGSALANVAYNLAQKPAHALTSDDVALLDKLRRQWDAALKANDVAERPGTQ